MMYYYIAGFKIQSRLKHKNRILRSSLPVALPTINGHSLNKRFKINF